MKMHHSRFPALLALTVLLCRCETAPVEPDGGDGNTAASDIELSVSSENIT